MTQTDFPKNSPPAEQKLELKPAEASLPPALLAALASDCLPSPPEIARRAKRNFSQAIRPPPAGPLPSAPFITTQILALFRANSQVSTVADVAVVEEPRPSPMPAGSVAPVSILPEGFAPSIQLRPEPVVVPLKSMFEPDTPSEDERFATALALATQKPKGIQRMLTRFASLRVHETSNGDTLPVAANIRTNDVVSVRAPLDQNRNKDLPSLPAPEVFAESSILQPSETMVAPVAVVVRDHKLKPVLRRRATSAALISVPLGAPSAEPMPSIRTSRRRVHFATAVESRSIEAKTNRPTSSRKRMQAKSRIVVAVLPYSGPEKGYLDFEPGDFIQVLERKGEWWKGLFEGFEGWFPSHCVTADGIEWLP
jgi:hypothetical protein